MEIESGRGHAVSYALLHKEAYRLFALANAAERLRIDAPAENALLSDIAAARGEGEASGPGFGSLMMAAIAAARDEVPPLLISLAAIARAKSDDGSWLLAGFQHQERVHGSVAQLSVGSIFDEPSSSRLEIRELCNKILHAQRVQYLPVPTQYSGAIFDLPSDTVELSGKLHGQPWTVRFSLSRYSAALLRTVF